MLALGVFIRLTCPFGYDLYDLYCIVKNKPKGQHNRKSISLETFLSMLLTMLQISEKIG